MKQRTGRSKGKKKEEYKKRIQKVVECVRNWRIHGAERSVERRQRKDIAG